MAVAKTGPERGRAPLWATLVATGFGLGRLRPGPGTWASLAAALVWLVLARQIPLSWRPPVLVGLSLAAVGLGVPAASRTARALGERDPSTVVIDEVAGQWIALLAVAASWKTLLASFILFRGFDIWKPPPVRQLERLPEGWGIVFDDVAAGLYAFAVIKIIRHFGLFSAWL